MDDHFSVEWELWVELRPALPALDWPAMFALRRKLRVVFAENRYDAAQRMAFYVAARTPGTWQARVIALCADPAAMRTVFHWPRHYFAVDGRARYQAMEVAA